jgi:hypothetical protein
VGGVQRTIYDAEVEVSKPAGQPWVSAATGLLFTDGANRGLSLRGEELPQSVLNDLIENADLGQRSGTAEIEFETAKFRLTFKWRAVLSL